MIVDTSNLITAERRGHGVADILAQIQRAYGETRAGLSVVTIAELSHGIERAKTDAQKLAAPPANSTATTAPALSAPSPPYK